MRWLATAQPVAADGTIGHWSRVFNGQPSVQVFGDGRGMVSERGGAGACHIWRRCDGVRAEPLPGFGVGWAVVGVLVGVVLGVASRRRELSVSARGS